MTVDIACPHCKQPIELGHAEVVPYAPEALKFTCGRCTMPFGVRRATREGTKHGVWEVLTIGNPS